MLKKEQQLGEIPPSVGAYKKFFQIAVPSIVELVFMSLIGSVDTMMVGGLGKVAISAVGLSAQPRLLFFAPLFALNIGLTAIVARRKGEDNPKEANIALKNSLVIAFALSVVLTAVAMKYSDAIMLFSGAKEDSLQWATEYFYIMQLSIPLSALSLAITAAQRGVGNTKITMYVNLTANCVNVMFNFLLIKGHWGFPALGVKGAAIASVIGIACGLLLSIISVLRPYSYINLRNVNEWKFNKKILQSLTKVGSSALLEQISVRIGFFMFIRMVAELGTLYLSAHQICVQFLNLTYSFADGLAIAGTVLIGQYLGEKRPDLALIYGKIGQRIALTMSMAMILILTVFRYPLVEIFIDERDVIDLAVNVMFFVAIFQPFQTTQVVLAGCLRGAGDTRYVAIIMITCILLVRPLAALLAINQLGWGLYGAWAASLFDIALRMVLVYWRFNQLKWTKIEV